MAYILNSTGAYILAPSGRRIVTRAVPTALVAGLKVRGARQVAARQIQATHDPSLVVSAVTNPAGLVISARELS